MRSRAPVGEALEAELGLPRRIRKLASSPRSRVWRADLAGTGVVIKQLVAGPGADERFAREVAALRAASGAHPPVVPRLLGTDPAERVLVIEHVENRTPPADWQIGYAAALGRLHAVPTDSAALPAWSGPTGQDIEAFLKLAARLATPAGDGVGAELDALTADSSPRRKAWPPDSGRRCWSGGRGCGRCRRGGRRADGYDAVLGLGQLLLGSEETCTQPVSTVKNINPLSSTPTISPNPPEASALSVRHIVVRKEDRPEIWRGSARSRV